MQLMNRAFIEALLLSLVFFLHLRAEETQLDGIVEHRETKGLSLELISEVNSVKAGQPFLVGFKIAHDPGFHTYWQNPGIVGIPFTLSWDLPEGFSASEIHWPYPEPSMMADYPCFGYNRDVLLMVKITPSKKLKGNPVTLTVNANWMCCSSICYPDLKTFSMTLATGERAINPETAELFRIAKTEIPAQTKDLKAQLLSAPADQQIKVKIVSDNKEEMIYVFNSDGQTTPDLGNKIIKQQDGSWIYTATRSKFGAQSAETFPFILKTSLGYFKQEAK